jgi:hypothetical protein
MASATSWTSARLAKDKTYAVKAWLRGKNTGKVNMLLKDASPAAGKSIEVSEAWKQYSLEFKPGSEQKVKVYFGFVPERFGTLWVDDVTIEEK